MNFFRVCFMIHSYVRLDESQSSCPKLTTNAFMFTNTICLPKKLCMMLMKQKRKKKLYTCDKLIKEQKRMKQKTRDSQRYMDEIRLRHETMCVLFNKRAKPHTLSCFETEIIVNYYVEQERFARCVHALALLREHAGERTSNDK